MMKKVSEYAVLWAIGGCLYYTFEFIFRGFSHWTMFVLGGICFLFCAVQGIVTNWEDALWIQLLRCMLFSISSEFITGIVVNKWLGWNVWDYSNQPYQLWGQICLPFAIIFMGLCMISILVSGYLTYWLYQETKPHYHVF